eukprot:568141-Pelagomonas_calceolata.AAC.2
MANSPGWGEVRLVVLDDTWLGMRLVMLVLQDKPVLLSVGYLGTNAMTNSLGWGEIELGAAKWAGMRTCQEVP